jgi:wobble nucleotide-excising tRNase
MYKKVKRPLRIFTKSNKPYIIYKDKKYNIKSTEIKDMLKFINKLNKKTIKKVSTDNKKKKDIKKYVNESIKLLGSPISSNIQPINLEKDTFLINKLNEKIEKDKIKIDKLDDNIKAIE